MRRATRRQLRRLVQRWRAVERCCARERRRAHRDRQLVGPPLRDTELGRDVGGRVAGSNASDSTEIYAEGLRIAPLKLYEAGKINKTIMTFIEKNVRLPVKVFGDLRAQLAACHIAEQQFAELVAKHGPEQTADFMRETVDYAERLTRASLARLPDGEWSFEDWIDDDGIDYGKPIRLFVTIRKTGDHMVVDWTGTSPQVKGAINNTLSFTKAASYTGSGVGHMLGKGGAASWRGALYFFSASPHFAQLNSVAVLFEFEIDETALKLKLCRYWNSSWPMPPAPIRPSTVADRALDSKR